MNPTPTPAPTPAAGDWTPGSRALWYDDSWNGHTDGRIGQTIFDGTIETLHVDASGTLMATFGAHTPWPGETALRPLELTVPASELLPPQAPDAPYGQVEREIENTIQIPHVPPGHHFIGLTLQQFYDAYDREC